MADVVRFAHINKQITVELLMEQPFVVHTPICHTQKGGRLLDLPRTINNPGRVQRPLQLPRWGDAPWIDHYAKNNWARR